MKRCCLCKKTSAGQVPHFSVPKDEKRREKWNVICQMQLKSSHYICADHFDSSQIIRSGRKMQLMPHAVPILPSVGMRQSLSYTNRHLLTNQENGIQCMKVEADGGPEFLNDPLSLFDNSESRFSTKEQETQTEPVAFAKENQKYRETIRRLETKNKDLKLELSRANLAISSMNKIFTAGQIQKLKSPGRIDWAWEDISSAMSLHAAGPEAYEHLYKKGFPLPHVSTLQRWCQKDSLNQGTESLDNKVNRVQILEDDTPDPPVM